MMTSIGGSFTASPAVDVVHRRDGVFRAPAEAGCGEAGFLAVRKFRQRAVREFRHPSARAVNRSPPPEPNRCADKISAQGSN